MMSLTAPALGVEPPASTKSSTPTSEVPPREGIARALILLDQSKYEESIVAAQQALGAAIRLYGGDHPTTLDALHTFGQVLAEAGEYERAFDPVSRAVAGRTRVLGDTHEKTWESQLTLATVLGQTMRLRECERVLRELLRVQEATLGLDHPRQAMTFANLASLQLRLGRLNEALLTHRKANALYHAAHSPLTLDSFVLRFNWMQALNLAGQSAEAITIGESAVKECVALVGEQHESCLILLNNLASAYESEGNSRKGFELFQRAAQLAPRVLGENHPTAYRLELNASFQRAMRGSSDDLDKLHDLIARRTKLGEDKTATGLASGLFMANTLSAHGRFAEAAPLFEKIVSARSAQHGDQHPESIYAATGWAHSLFHLGRTEEAVGLLDQIVGRIEDNRELIGLQGADGQRDWSSAFINPYLSRLEFLIKTGHTSRAFQAADELKARQLMERLRSRAIPLERVLPPEMANVLTRLQDELWDLDVQLAGTVEPHKRDALRQLRVGTAERLARATSEARHLAPRYATLTNRRRSQVSDLGALGEGEVYVAWVLLEGMRLAMFTTDKAGKVTARTSEQLPGLVDMIQAMRLWTQHMTRVDRPVHDDAGRLIHFMRWTDPEGRVRWRATSGATCTHDQMRDESNFLRLATVSHLAGVARRRGPGSHRPGPDCAPAGAVRVFGAAGRQELAKDLGQVLFGSVLRDLAGQKKLLLSPDGPLWLLPWDLIVREVMVDKKPVSLAHNLALAAHLRRQEHPPREGLEQLLAIGDPAYPVPAASGTGTGRSFGGFDRQRLRGGSNPGNWLRLPYSRVEVEESAKLFPKQNTLVLTGKRARADSIRDLSSRGQLGNFSHVLFSVHGYFDPNLPGASGLVLAPDSSSGEAPSFLTVTDMALLRMNSRLTVLSACNSALGILSAGEGLMGLSYALKLAGTRKSLVTLWPVADRAAAAFVLDFMRRIRRGVPETQALADTKKYFAAHPSRELSSPSLWAAFMLHGA